jgi:hypothetical protein
MDTLWLKSGSAQVFLVPEQQLIINRQGELLPYAASCAETSITPIKFAELCNEAQQVILLADTGLFDAEYLSLIPSSISIVAVLTEHVDAQLREQLSDCGVDGYLSAAMSARDIALSLGKIATEKTAAIALQAELKSFSNIAFTAMSSASEMGAVAVFAEKVQEVMELDQLAKLIQRCLGDFGLEGVIQFSFERDFSVYPKDASISCKRLLQGSLDSSARIISHSRFLLFSFEHLQLLITDAPFEDVERYGRLRDVLAHVASIAEARAKTLRVNQLLKDQQDNTRMVMMLLEMASKDNRNSVKDIMSNLSLSLRDLALGMDLTLEQEGAMLQLSERALNSLESLQEATMAVEDHFRSLVQQLDNVTSLLEAPAAAARTDTEKNDDQDDGSVCLF